ncbi:VOC family protein [Tabrizicola fusiformis]|uniref:VOC family protein n=1 Tax=Tabrizicola sp. SY72 TaxID=2741673 RepID=UPI00157428A3|nr:VOC family protein [Tabrizicola sp. SY72]NTT85886.1 VOC family protein [Tabrizicola sp. SY72]
MTAPTVQTCLWFEDAALEAAETYVRLLPGSTIRHVFPQRGNPGAAFMVQLDLLGQRYSFLNGGPHYRLTPAASIEVHLETQAEVDALWDALLNGGSASRCGWLTDRFGVSWQIIPRALPRLMATNDEAAAARVLQAMMAMVKLDGPALEAAARG